MNTFRCLLRRLWHREEALPAPSPSTPSPPASMTRPAPKEKRRAIGPIGHPDVAPPSPALYELAQQQEAGGIADGAIAAIWHSSRYYERYGGSDHPERDGKVYLVRGSWVYQRGWVCAGPDGYMDEITLPGEELGCECHYQFLYALRDLPPQMLTKAGEDSLAEARAKIAALGIKIPRVEFGEIRQSRRPEDLSGKR
jgi:hypothetical protein